MYEKLVDRCRVTLMLALFLLPVFAAAWSRGIHDWWQQKHRYEAAPLPDSIVQAQARYNASGSQHSP